MADVSATPHTREALHAPPMKRAATRTPRVGISNIIAVWLWLGWVANYLFIFVGLGVSHALGWRVCRSVLLGFLGVLFLLPANAGVSFLAPTFGAWIMKRASEYFGMQLVFEEKAAIRDAQSPMIFAIEPHDVLPVSMGSFHPSLDLVPGHTCAGLTTSAVFSVPGLRNIYSILHAHPVDRSTFSSLLSAGKSVCFCPGGVQEVFHLAHEKEVVLFLKSRLGFAQIALQHRTPAVPCFTFGLGGTYSHRFARGKLAEQVARMIGFLPGVFWGLFGVPYGPPRPRALTTVIGKPVELPPLSDQDDGALPSRTEVAAYHARFVEAMQQLYHEHKAAYGMADISLRII